jgi:hypothetical protein
MSRVFAFASCLASSVRSHFVNSYMLVKGHLSHGCLCTITHSLTCTNDKVMHGVKVTHSRGRSDRLITFDVNSNARGAFHVTHKIHTHIRYSEGCTAHTESYTGGAPLLSHAEAHTSHVAHHMNTVERHTHTSRVSHLTIIGYGPARTLPLPLASCVCRGCSP